MATKKFLQTFSVNSIPKSEFQYLFSRSSGPGGQNVNKLNTKATIKYAKEQWDSAGWIPLDVKQRIDPKNFPYFTKSGGIIISSELTRSQRNNLDNCFDKLADAIKSAAFVPEDPSAQAQERWVRLRKKEDAHRQDRKKQHSTKKSSRREKF